MKALFDDNLPKHNKDNPAITVTSRAYGWEHLETWKCPSCGARNQHYNDTNNDECWNCGQTVVLNYKIMRGRYMR